VEQSPSRLNSAGCSFTNDSLARGFKLELEYARVLVGARSPPRPPPPPPLSCSSLCSSCCCSSFCTAACNPAKHSSTSRSTALSCMRCLTLHSLECYPPASAGELLRPRTPICFATNALIPAVRHRDCWRASSAIAAVEPRRHTRDGIRPILGIGAKKIAFDR